MLVDTHAHLYWDSFKQDFDQVIKRSIDAHVTTIINVGVDIELSKKALEQTREVLSKIPNFKAYSTIGIHPHEAIKFTDTSSIHHTLEQLEKLYQTAPDQIVAIGECGLDYYFDNNPSPSSLSINEQKDLQRQLFRSQIDLAKKLNLPLIVHCRDDKQSLRSDDLRPKIVENSEAWDEVLQLIGDHPTILHCYSGLLKTTQQALNMPNVLISFAATITYPKNEYLREAARILPLEKIVLETDCPFLPPQSKRGERNEPANIKELAQFIAELKGTTLEKVAHQTSANASKVFDF